MVAERRAGLLLKVEVVEQTSVNEWKLVNDSGGGEPRVVANDDGEEERESTRYGSTEFYTLVAHASTSQNSTLHNIKR